MDLLDLAIGIFVITQVLGIFFALLLIPVGVIYVVFQTLRGK
jgi:hypothetical protein